MTAKTVSLPSPSLAWTDGRGLPTQAFTQFMTQLANGNFGGIFPTATNDADAAKRGVQIGWAYIRSGAVVVRIS